MDVSRFTNCIVVVLLADDVNQTPPISYTFSPIFRSNRNRTPIRDLDEDDRGKCLRDRQVSEDRCVYVTNAAGEKRIYVSESLDTLKRVFRA